MTSREAKKEEIPVKMVSGKIQREQRFREYIVGKGMRFDGERVWRFIRTLQIYMTN